MEEWNQPSSKTKRQSESLRNCIEMSALGDTAQRGYDSDYTGGSMNTAIDTKVYTNRDNDPYW